MGNFISGNVFPSSEQLRKYNPIPFVNSDFPRTFAIGSNYHGDGYAYDMAQLAQQLKSDNVEHEFFYQTYPDGTEPRHGFLSNLKNDDLAKKAFNQMMAFIQAN